jgi:ribonuclease-3
VRFQQPAWLVEALTHRSYLNEQTGAPVRSNERLEFLGDSALGFVIARYLFGRFPDLTEGELTGRRAALIRTSTLAAWAREFDLASVLRLGQGEVSAGPVRDSILADAFEAVLGAILLDGGVEGLERFLLPLLERHADTILQRSVNYKGRLQEVVQEQEHVTPAYRTVAITGPHHDSLFTVEVVAGARVLAQGSGRSKQAAQQEAARLALSQYESVAEEGE